MKRLLAILFGIMTCLDQAYAVVSGEPIRTEGRYNAFGEYTVDTTAGGVRVSGVKMAEPTPVGAPCSSTMLAAAHATKGTVYVDAKGQQKCKPTECAENYCMARMTSGRYAGSSAGWCKKKARVAKSQFCQDDEEKLNPATTPTEDASCDLQTCHTYADTTKFSACQYMSLVTAKARYGALNANWEYVSGTELICVPTVCKESGQVVKYNTDGFYCVIENAGNAVAGADCTLTVGDKTVAGINVANPDGTDVTCMAKAAACNADDGLVFTHQGGEGDGKYGTCVLAQAADAPVVENPAPVVVQLPVFDPSKGIVWFADAISAAFDSLELEQSGAMYQWLATREATNPEISAQEIADEYVKTSVNASASDTQGFITTLINNQLSHN